MAEFGKSDEIIKISGKGDISNTYEFISKILFLIQRRTKKFLSFSTFEQL